MEVGPPSTECGAANNGEVQIMVAGELVISNRDLLCSSSAYFQAMFNSNMKESVSNVVKLQDVPVSIMRLLVDSAHSGHADLTDNNASEVLVYANMLQFEQVIKQVTDYLLQRINEDNCLLMLSMSDTHGVNELYNRAKAYTLWYFEVITQQSDFLELSSELLLDLLQCDTIKVK